MFGRLLWTEALTSKRLEIVAKSFVEDILTRAGGKPKTVTSKFRPELQGPFAEALKAKGVEVYTKREEDMNAIATIDTAIGY